MRFFLKFKNNVYYQDFGYEDRNKIIFDKELVEIKKGIPFVRMPMSKVNLVWNENKKIVSVRKGAYNLYKIQELYKKNCDRYMDVKSPYITKVSFYEDFPNDFVLERIFILTEENKITWDFKEKDEILACHITAIKLEA